MNANEIMKLAEHCGLGMAMQPLGRNTGLVFGTTTGYNTLPLLEFASALFNLAAKDDALLERTRLAIEEKLVVSHISRTNTEMAIEIALKEIAAAIASTTK